MAVTVTAAYGLFIGGDWIRRPSTIEVKNPFDGERVAVVAAASADDVRAAVSAAEASLAKERPNKAKLRIVRTATLRMEPSAQDVDRIAPTIQSLNCDANFQSLPPRGLDWNILNLKRFTRISRALRSKHLRTSASPAPAHVKVTIRHGAAYCNSAVYRRAKIRLT